MFDHYYSSSNNRGYPNSIDVTINRAPTDASIKLLREMEEKAFNNIVAQFKVENSIVNGIVTYFNLDFATDSYKIVWKFKINEKDYIIKEEIDRFDLSNYPKDKILIEFYKRVTKVIGEMLILDALKSEEVRRII